MGYIYWFILGLYKTPPPKKHQHAPSHGRAPHQLFLYMEVPHRITDLMEEPGSLARGVPFEWLGFDAFGHQNMLGSCWIMLDLQILSTTLDNSGGMLLVYPDVGCCTFTIIHHILSREVDQQAFMFFIDQEHNGGLHQKIVWLLVSIFPSTTICPCLVFWERPTIQQAVQQVASCRLRP